MSSIFGYSDQIVSWWHLAPALGGAMMSALLVCMGPSANIK